MVTLTKLFVYCIEVQYESVNFRVKQPIQDDH